MIFLLITCRATNSEFIRSLNHHEFEANQSNLLQPRIEILASHQQKDEIKKLNLVLDTGSNVSLIRQGLFPKSGEPVKFKIKSLSGEIDGEFSEQRLNLYDKEKKIIGSSVPFQSFNFDSKFTFDGILGNDVLSNYDIFLELPENVYLIQPHQSQKRFSGFTKIPFTYVDGHILIQVKISNKPCLLILDTGAGISYLNQSKAKELNLKIGGKASFMDLRGELQDTIYHLAENLCVAENICQKKIELLSGNSIQDFLSREGNLDGILGMNWLENYSVLINYKNLELHIKKR